MSIERSATLNRDARAWRSMRLGEEPLIPKGAHQQGPGEVITAAIARLAQIRRRRSDPEHHGSLTRESEHSISQMISKTSA
jgi:hypothetical protein